MNYLIKSVETYKVANEAAAANMIEKAKKDPRFTLMKYEAIHKEKKVKGEVVDEWIRVTLLKVFNSEAEPDSEIEIDYKKTIGAFPEPVEKEEEEVSLEF